MGGERGGSWERIGNAAQTHFGKQKFYGNKRQSFSLLQELGETLPMRSHSRLTIPNQLWKILKFSKRVTCATLQRKIIEQRDF